MAILEDGAGVSSYGVPAVRALAKLTAKNQLTLPKAALVGMEGTEYFDVAAGDGRIVLTPVRLARAGAVRAKLAELGVAEPDIEAAVAWARRGE